jgi:hypothetical protein
MNEITRKNLMKKIISTFAFVSTMALGTSVFAAGKDVADCATLLNCRWKMDARN